MPDNNFKLLRDGFTLIEVLVSIGLIAIVTAVAIPNFRNFSSTQEIDGATSQLINVLKTAQSSATSRIKCPTNNEASTNWSIILTGTIYTLKSQCAGTGGNPTVYTSPYASTPNSLTTFQMTNNRCQVGETLTVFFTNQQVTYQCNSTAGSLWPIIITLSNTASTSTKQVTVEQGGIIR